MSLSDRAKIALRASIEEPKKMFGPRAEAIMLEQGPAKLIEDIIGGAPPEAVAELRENRKEAEQFVAGLLGMM